MTVAERTILLVFDASGLFTPVLCYRVVATLAFAAGKNYYITRHEKIL